MKLIRSGVEGVVAQLDGSDIAKTGAGESVHMAGQVPKDPGWYQLQCIWKEGGTLCQLRSATKFTGLTPRKPAQPRPPDKAPIVFKRTMAEIFAERGIFETPKESKELIPTVVGPGRVEMRPPPSRRPGAFDGMVAEGRAQTGAAIVPEPQGRREMAGRTRFPMQTAELSLGGILGGIGKIATGLIPGTLDDRLLDALTGRPGQQDPRGAGFAGQGFGGGTSCAPGFIQGPDGRCIRAGVRGTVERVLPGGATGTQADIFGDAVMGMYGVALVPAQENRLVNICPSGMVLGDDNLCYKHVHKRDRKWKPATKPFLTGGDVNAIKKARRLEKKFRKLSGRGKLFPR